jgi:hypothetical protein
MDSLCLSSCLTGDIDVPSLQRNHEILSPDLSLYYTNASSLFLMSLTDSTAYLLSGHISELPLDYPAACPEGKCPATVSADRPPYLAFDWIPEFCLPKTFV